MSLECSKEAKEHDRYVYLAETHNGSGFDMFEVEVPVGFFGTEGFSARRDGR